MSVFCIVLAVFLVAVIFGMADMFIRSQIMQTRMEEGNWHIMLNNISEEDANLISVRPEVTAFSRYGIINYRGDQEITLSGKDVSICGCDESFITKMQVDVIQEGAFPQMDHEAMITESAKSILGLQMGDQISVNAPDGMPLQFTISGFSKNFSKIMQEDTFGVVLTTKAFQSLQNRMTGVSVPEEMLYYVQFSTHDNIQKTISEIKSQFELSNQQISENTKLLGLLGQSGNAFMLQIYGSAVILFLLVLLAGIMMIASSLNSNVAQRTEFFGMLRCIGATKKQVMQFVRREALNWCKVAIPVGIATGVVVIWILCAILRYLSPEYFMALPVFSISVPSIIAGIAVGFLTVLLAVRAPAKKAASVSPLAAVSGNANPLSPVKKAVNMLFFKIETSLGIHHAKASKKNFILMVASFSLSIILFLSFSITIDFMHHALRPLKPWTPDVSIISMADSADVDKGLLEQIQEKPVVKRAYGRMFAYNIPVTVNGAEEKVNLISYEQNQFEWAKDYLLEGNIEQVQDEKNTGLLVFDQQSGVQVGETITLQIGERISDIRVSGLLSSSPFRGASGVGTLICSEDTFTQLTGKEGYTIIDVQLSKNASEEDVVAIRRLAGTAVTFSDERLGNRSVIGSYYSFGLFIYGFMVLIALITIFNIINSIAMSVSSRMKQYGAFRAIGLSNRQLVQMIFAEATTYAVTGTIFGSMIGLMVNKLLYTKMITSYWGEQWHMPLVEMATIIVIIIVSVIFAVRGPARRIRNMSIVDTISAL